MVKNPPKTNALVQNLQEPAPRIFAGTVVAEILKTAAADHVKILALTVKSPSRTDALAQNLRKFARWIFAGMVSVETLRTVAADRSPILTALW